MNRRGFLGSILALGVAPAIVRADSLMRIVPREMTLALPGFGQAHAFQALPDSQVLMSIDMITREVLRVAHEKSAFIGNVKRMYAAPVKQTIQIRRPNRYQIREA